MMNRSADTFGVQRAVRGPWRRYVDQLEEHRPAPAPHAYCRRLTGNVWDGEDLVQDTLLRVFSLLGSSASFPMIETVRCPLATACLQHQCPVCGAETH
jgi:hypothetical protein